MRYQSAVTKIRNTAAEGGVLGVRELKTVYRTIGQATLGLSVAVMLLLCLPVVCIPVRRALENPLGTLVDMRPQIIFAAVAAAVLAMLYAAFYCARLYRLRRVILKRDADAERYACAYCDRLSRDFLPTVFFAAVSVFIGLMLSFFAPKILISEYVLVFAIAALLSFGSGARMLCAVVFRRLLLRSLRFATDLGDVCTEKPRSHRKHVLLCAAYWLVVLGLYLTGSLLFGSFTLYLHIPVLGQLLYGLLRLANRTKRSGAQRCVFARVVRNIVAIAAVTAVGATVLVSGSWINSMYIYTKDYSVFSREKCPIDYDAQTGVYTLTATQEEFRILQLTDIHLGGSLMTVFEDRQALDACYRLILQASPDLIIITGDIAYPIVPQSFSLNNQVPFDLLRSFLDMVDIPWAIVYGNHDTEKSALQEADTISETYASYARNNPEMLFADRQPAIYGRYNQYIRINNSDGSLNRILFLLDSNDYVYSSAAVREYDSVHDDQIQWYADTIDRLSAQEGFLVPSFVFLHIPFKAYDEAWQALQNGQTDARYLFGEKREEVHYPQKESRLFQTMLEKGSTQAVFAGHDHINDFGVNYQGIDLVYSKSIDYIAYPGIAEQTEQRGGTLIVLDKNGYSIQPLAYNSGQ